MDPILLIFLCICLTAITIACIVAAKVLLDAQKQIARVVVVVESASRDISEVRRQMDPVLVEVREFIDKATSTLDVADTELAKVGRGADTFAAIAEDIRKVEQNIVSRLEAPIADITNVVAGTAKGVSAFVRKMMNR